MFDEEEFYDYEIWFGHHIDYFDPEFIKTQEVRFSMNLFRQLTCKEAMDELRPNLRRLMHKQFPLFSTETRPLVVKELDKIIQYTGMHLLYSLFLEVLHQKGKTNNINERFPDLNSWLELYARPKEPNLIDVSTYDDFPTISMEDKQELVETINKETIDNCKEYESRRFEFFDLVQNVIFKHYPNIQILEGDGWSVFGILIGIEYQYFRDSCYHINNFIEAGLPEEDILLDWSEYMEKLYKANSAKRAI